MLAQLRYSSPQANQITLMPDLVTIQGGLESMRGLSDIPTLEVIDETARQLEDNVVIVAAFADDAAKTEVQTRGLTITLIKTEAQYDADIQEAYAAISDVPYDFGGIV